MLRKTVAAVKNAAVGWVRSTGYVIKRRVSPAHVDGRIWSVRKKSGDRSAAGFR